MTKIEIIAAGQLKKGPLFELGREYIKRLQWPVKIIEITGSGEHQKLAKHIKSDSFLVALDERGKSLSSTEFAKTIEKLQNTGRSQMQFIIGGADGLSDDIRSRANLLLSFGAQTWPHMLARILLLEQIYRAQQILSGHPYHRE